jgi:predicted ABC-type ATPase
MNHSIPRLRIFAGPNGSGKSTIKDLISSELWGIYINPDEIEKEMAKFDFVDLRQYKIQTTDQEVREFFANSKLLARADLELDASNVRYNDDKIIFFNAGVNSYFASVCADFIRQKLLELRKSFTFETVMSSFDKVELLKRAQSLGSRTYLYYVATNDPEINISRVRQRVNRGGHSVPSEKIITRYNRSLSYLVDAVSASNRAYIFDNSEHAHTWLCEITDGLDVEIKQERIPNWFSQFFLNKI